MNINDYTWLFNTIAVSGKEETLARVVLTWLRENTDWNIEFDKFGNVIVANTKNQIPEPIVFCAHLDEVGIMLQRRVGSNWKFIAIGSLNADLLIGNEIVVNGKKGIVISTNKNSLEIGKYDYKKLSIAFSDDDNAALSVGDIGSFTTSMRIEQKKVIGKALDNRIGCMILMDLIKEIPAKSISENIQFVFTREEEIGGRGIQFYSYNNSISKLICIDATCLSSDNNISIDGGPCLIYADGSSQGDIGIIQDMENLAEKHGIVYQRAVNSLGFTESAFPPIVSAAKTLTIAYPVDYIHRDSARSSIFDLQMTKKLLSYYIRFIGGIHEEVD